MLDSFIIHSSMEISYADSVFCTLLGVDSGGQLVGKSLTDIVLQEYHSDLREQVARIENKDAPALGLAVELQTLTDQSESVILVSSRIEWNDTQQVQTLVFPVVEADSPTARLLRDQAMDEAPIGITISDPSQSDNPLIYVNDGFCELTGYPRDEILGQNCRFLQGDATDQEPVAQMREAIDSQEPVTVDLRNYRKDGSMFWNRVTIVPIRSMSGQVTNFLGYQQDVTAEKRFEQDLTLFEEQAEESDKAIFITDSHGTIQYVNPAFERITGYSATEAIGKSPRILRSGHQDDEFYDELWEQITAGEVWEADITNQTKYGEFYEVHQKVIPITDQSGDITRFVAIEENTTEQILRIQALDVLNRVLRHNLRNALNVIDGNAELLDSEEIDSESRQALVQTIRKHVQSLQKTAEKTEKVRAIWKPGKLDRGWGGLDIRALIEKYRRQYPDAEIHADITGDGDVQVRNVGLFEIALDEAIENAIEHAERTHPEVTIATQRATDDTYVLISVADNGSGIPENEREVMEVGAETPLNHGAGIGFWLMEWVATSLGGELLISENQPRGSVVTFQLPDQS